MASLPFVVQPRRQPIVEQVGTEESGIIEIERRGYLTTGEKAFVQQVQQYDNGTTEVVTICRRVAREYGYGMEKAYALVMAAVSGVPSENEDEAEVIRKIDLDYADELADVLKGLAVAQTREDMVLAACMLKYRVDQNFDLGMVGALHPDLISALAGLYRDEEKQSLEAFQAEGQKPPSIEEVEKKSVRAKGTRSRTTTGASKEGFRGTQSSN